MVGYPSRKAVLAELERRVFGMNYSYDCDTGALYIELTDNPVGGDAPE